jgi:hypothetical protein
VAISALDYAIDYAIYENWEGLHLNGTHQLLINNDDVYLFGKIYRHIKILYVYHPCNTSKFLFHCPFHLPIIKWFSLPEFAE